MFLLAEEKLEYSVNKRDFFFWAQEGEGGLMSSTQRYFS